LTPQTRILLRRRRGCSAAQLQQGRKSGDFRIVASHQKGLHSHDAVSIPDEGATFASGKFVDRRLFIRCSVG